MIAQGRVTHLYVAANAALPTTAAPATARYLGIRRVGETACTAGALAAHDAFNILYYDANSKLEVSPLIRFDDVLRCTRVTPTSAVSQVSNIGYVGSGTYDIVETNYGKYLITLGFRDTLKMIGGKRLYKYADYTAGATCHKYDVAIGLAGSLYANLNQDVFLRVVPQAICSSTVTAANSWDAHDATVVQYSQYVTVGTNTHYTTGNTALVVGDYLRIGTVGGGTALTNSVYRVIELTSSTVIKLDRPVTEASGTYTGTSGTSDSEVIPKATAEASTIYWGIVLTGNDTAQPFTVGMYGNNVIQFSVGVSPDFGATVVAVGTSPVEGKIVYHDVAQLDWELQANRREAYRVAEWPVPFTSNASSGDSYTSAFVITVIDTHPISISGKTESPYQVMIVTCGGTIDTALQTTFGALPSSV